MFLTYYNSRIGVAKLISLLFLSICNFFLCWLSFTSNEYFVIVGRIKHGKSQCGKVQILLCKPPILKCHKIYTLHNFKTDSIIINYYSSPRTVSVKVLTLPVATKRTLPARRHLNHVKNSDKKCMCQLEVATQRDCLQERFRLACKWFLHRVFIASKSQRTIF